MNFYEETFLLLMSKYDHCSSCNFKNSFSCDRELLLTQGYLCFNKMFPSRLKCLDDLILGGNLATWLVLFPSVRKVVSSSPWLTVWGSTTAHSKTFRTILPLDQDLKSLG